MMGPFKPHTATGEEYWSQDQVDIRAGGKVRSQWGGQHILQVWSSVRFSHNILKVGLYS